MSSFVVFVLCSVVVFSLDSCVLGCRVLCWFGLFRFVLLVFVSVLLLSACTFGFVTNLLCFGLCCMCCFGLLVMCLFCVMRCAVLCCC